MKDLLRLLDAAEAAYEQNPCPKNEEWIEDILDKIFGYNLGIMGINKPRKTPINSNKISKNKG